MSLVGPSERKRRSNNTLVSSVLAKTLPNGNYTLSEVWHCTGGNEEQTLTHTSLTHLQFLLSCVPSENCRRHKHTFESRRLLNLFKKEMYCGGALNLDFTEELLHIIGFLPGPFNIRNISTHTHTHFCNCYRCLMGKNQ